MILELAGADAFNARQRLVGDQRRTVAGEKDGDLVAFVLGSGCHKESERGLRRIVRSGVDVDEKILGEGPGSR